MMNLVDLIRESGFCRIGGPPGEIQGVALLIHGLGESSLCFQGLLESEGMAGWRLVAPDLPGYGQTPSTQRFSLSAYADLLGGWIESSSPLPLVVIGHSMGGVIGQFLCELVTAKVQAFVNVEGNLSLEDCAFSGIAARDTEADFSRSGFDRLLNRVEEAGRNDPASDSYARSMRLCQIPQFHQNSLELVELSKRERMAKRMANLSLPGVYIAGLRDRPQKSRSLELLEESSVNWLGFSASGHWPFIDELQRFQQVLNDLLHGLSAFQDLTHARPQE